MRYLLLLPLFCFDLSIGFLHYPSSIHPALLFRADDTGAGTLILKQTSAGYDDDGNMKITNDQDDWRAFRAKLVQEEKGDLTDNKWTYDAGMLIERGSLVVSKVEDSLGCHDLRQPYFAKCVVLLVEHDEIEFTQGIILNRPSNLNLKDQDIVYLDDDGEQIFSEDETSDTSWRNMFFGGDIASLYDENENPLIVCLHNDTSEMAQSVSDEILPGVFLTSHLGARSLVEEGTLCPDACFTFYGFCGWDPGQLQREVKRGSWSIVSVDSDTLWSDLASLRPPNNDPREVGLDMWERIMETLDKQENGKENDEDQTRERERKTVSEFQNLMLKEWATQVLMLPEQEKDETYVEDNDIFQAIRAASRTSQIQVGALLRGSSQEKSPFLLQDQFLHKSTLLLLQDSDDVSIAVALHLPTSTAIEVDLAGERKVVFPIRYGGPDGRSDEDPLLWFYYGPQQVGHPLGENTEISCIQSCSYEQVIDTLENDVADPKNFLIVRGFCLWQKGEQGSGGIKGEVIDGKFETVSSVRSSDILSHLGHQKLMSEDSLESNYKSILDAWEDGSVDSSDDKKVSKDRFVFDSQMTVSKLSDEALFTWIKIFLIGNAEYYR